jgi:hypothetical protein
LNQIKESYDKQLAEILHEKEQEFIIASHNVQQHAHAEIQRVIDQFFVEQRKAEQERQHIEVKDQHQRLQLLKEREKEIDRLHQSLKPNFPVFQTINQLEEKSEVTNNGSLNNSVHDSEDEAEEEQRTAPVDPIQHSNELSIDDLNLSLDLSENEDQSSQEEEEEDEEQDEEEDQENHNFDELHDSDYEEEPVVNRSDNDLLDNDLLNELELTDTEADGTNIQSDNFFLDEDLLGNLSDSESEL